MMQNTITGEFSSFNKRLTQKEVRDFLKFNLQKNGISLELDYILKNINISLAIEGGFKIYIEEKKIQDFSFKRATLLMENELNRIIKEGYIFSFLFLDVLGPTEVKIKRTLRD